MIDLLFTYAFYTFYLLNNPVNSLLILHVFFFLPFVSFIPRALQRFEKSEATHETNQLIFANHWV